MKFQSQCTSLVLLSKNWLKPHPAQRHIACIYGSTAPPPPPPPTQPSHSATSSFHPHIFLLHFSTKTVGKETKVHKNNNQIPWGGLKETDYFLVPLIGKQNSNGFCNCILQIIGKSNIFLSCNSIISKKILGLPIKPQQSLDQ